MSRPHNVNPPRLMSMHQRSTLRAVAKLILFPSRQTLLLDARPIPPADTGNLDRARGEKRGQVKFFTRFANLIPFIVGRLVEEGGAADRAVEDVVDVAGVGAARAACHAARLPRRRAWSRKI